jgi:hypothetical protein
MASSCDRCHAEALACWAVFPRRCYEEPPWESGTSGGCCSDHPEPQTPDCCSAVIGAVGTAREVALELEQTIPNHTLKY